MQRFQKTICITNIIQDCLDVVDYEREREKEREKRERERKVLKKKKPCLPSWKLKFLLLPSLILCVFFCDAFKKRREKKEEGKSFLKDQIC